MGDVIKLVSFDFEVINMHCVAPMPATTRYIINVFCVASMVVFVSLMHMVHCIIFSRADFKGKMPALIGVIGILFMIFYTSISLTVLTPLQCVSNPNSKWTVRSYQAVVCWESSEHTIMV